MFLGLSVVVRVPVIPATQEAEIGESQFETSPGKKKYVPVSGNKLSQAPVTHTCNPSYLTEIGNIKVQVSPG
jgi:hypothetical protein